MRTAVQRTHGGLGARASLFVLLFLLLGVVVRAGLLHGGEELAEEPQPLRLERDRLERRVLLKTRPHLTTTGRENNSGSAFRLLF